MKTANIDFPSPDAIKVQTRFELWRKNRSKRGKIPNQLWLVAVELTNHHSANQVAKLMRLNVSELKRRMSMASNPTVELEEKPSLSFIELPKISDYDSESCEIDLKRSDGSQMQIRLSGTLGTDLPAIIQAFIA